jgi:uncharacterized protein YdaU (DUF1376 family)
LNYYSHHIGDYRRDTAHLTLIEHGVYRQMLDQYYLDERPICANDAKLMRSLCARTADEMQVVKNVLADFFVLTESGYIHKRCDVEIEAFHGKSKSASESAKARWERVRAEKIAKLCEVNANALPTDNEGNANHKPLTINQEPLTNGEEKITNVISSKSPKSAIVDAIIGTVDHLPICPHGTLLNIFKAKCKRMPAPRTESWGAVDKAAMLSRWQWVLSAKNGETGERLAEDSQGAIDWFEQFFGYIDTIDFLNGVGSPTERGRAFKADLRWILKPANWAKIYDGKYE